MGKNWNSKTNSWNEIKSKDVLKKVELCEQYKSMGLSVSEISIKLGLSKSRVYEYLRK